MKTKITIQHTNIVAVQPQTTSYKEDRMKKRSFNTLKLAIFFAMVITMAMPAMAATCDRTSCQGYINTLYAQQPGGDVYVNIVGQGPVQSVLGCNLLSGYYFHLKLGTPGSEEIYNLLLQAKVNGIQVDIRAQVPSSDCQVLYVTTWPRL